MYVLPKLLQSTLISNLLIDTLLSTEKNYPVSESFMLIEGYDIYRSPNLIVALVVVES